MKPITLKEMFERLSNQDNEFMDPLNSIFDFEGFKSSKFEDRSESTPESESLEEDSSFDDFEESSERNLGLVV